MNNEYTYIYAAIKDSKIKAKWVEQNKELEQANPEKAETEIRIQIHKNGVVYDEPYK